MNAGGSERGRHFACKHADMVYTVIRNTDPDLNRKHVQAYHALAKEYGRKVQVWSLANIVQGETEKEAREFYNYYVNQKGDWEAAGNVVNSMAAEINARTYTPEQVKAMREVFVSAWGGNTLGRHQGADRRRARARLRAGGSTDCCSPSRGTRRACASSAT